jgi:hypothetical protein
LLQELLGSVGMTLQLRDDLAFEEVQLAGTLGALAGLVNPALDPFGDGFWIQRQGVGNLRNGQMFLLMQFPYLTKNRIADHAAPFPNTRRKMSPAD